MPAPHEVIPRLEGMVSTMAASAPQAVGEWIKQCKAILRLVGNRDYTDWDFAASPDVDESGNVIRNGASTLYAVLVETVSADTELDWVDVSNENGNTFDGTAALDNADSVVFRMPASGAAGTQTYQSWINPGGLVCGTGITVAADGQDGTNPATDDLRAWVLYRTA